jgi:hypothetical protein
VLTHARLPIVPRLEGIGGTPHAEGAGEQDGRFDFPEFAQLGFPEQLAVTIADEQGGSNGVCIEIARSGNDGGNPGTDILAFHARAVPHPHPFQVGDRVQGPGIKDSHLQADVPGPGPVGIGGERAAQQQGTGHGQKLAHGGSPVTVWQA